MDQAFKDKSAKIVVIEGSGASRTLVSEVLRKAGFTDITGVPEVKDAVGILEAENVDWVITSIFDDQPVNALHLLKISTEVPELVDMRISIMASEDELKFLPAAYKFGALSHHSKPFTKESLTEDVDLLLKRYEEEGYRSSFVAGHYLRSCLMELEKYDDLLQFEKALIKTYPSEDGLLFNLVPPLAKLDKKDDAKSVLRQIKMVDPSKEEAVKECCSKYLDGEDLAGAEGESFNFLSLDSVVVVDSDSGIQNNLKGLLGEIGVENVHCFDDGEAAAAFVKQNPNPSLILMEWRIPKMAGPLLVQRFRVDGAPSTPIMVVSSLLEKDDMPLVREIGVATVVEKPFQKEELLSKLIWTIQQDRMPSEQGTMERKIREHLKNKNIDEAMAIRANFMNDNSIPQGDKSAIEAEFCFIQRRYEDARDHGIEAIKQNGDSLIVLNLLGKTLMLLRDFEVALRCFQKAQSMSPMNIERLCQIAEVQSEMGDEEEAKKTMDGAKELDADNTQIKETETKIAINAGDTETAKKLMGQLDAIDNIVSFMNNSAVAMARCEMVDQGIEQYRKTLKSIPDDREDTKAIVMFNLAMAHARADELDEAKIHLGRAINIESRVKTRAQNLLKRITTALEKGSAFNLNLSANKDNPADVNAPGGAASGGDASAEENKDELPAIHLEVLAAVKAVAGSQAGFMIFLPENIDPDAAKLLENQPRFMKRAAIERDESAGADKAMAAG